jgi:hypothetical protein
MQPVMTPHLRELLRWSQDPNAGPRVERRGAAFTEVTLDGVPVGVEYRTVGHMHMTEAASFQERVDALIRQSEELLTG